MELHPPDVSMVKPCYKFVPIIAFKKNVRVVSAANLIGMHKVVSPLSRRFGRNEGVRPTTIYNIPAHVRNLQGSRIHAKIETLHLRIDPT